MTSLELGWARAALVAIFPGSRESGLVGIAQMDIASYLADVCRHVPRRAVIALRAAIWIVALAPLFVIGKLATIGRLSAADRERVIGLLMASRTYFVRQLVMVLKTTGALLYAAAPTVRARMRGPASAPSSPRLVPLRLKASA